MEGLEYLDLSDTISGLSFDDAGSSLKVFSDCLKDHHLRYLDLSDNALGPNGVLLCEPLIRVTYCFLFLFLGEDGAGSPSFQ